MASAEEDYYLAEADTRNVKAQADSRGKRVCMVSKSYSHKAVEKILYAKGEKWKRDTEKREKAAEQKHRREENAEWGDPTSERHARKLKDKIAREEEKARKKLEKIKLNKDENKKTVKMSSYKARYKI